MVLFDHFEKQNGHDKTFLDVLELGLGDNWV